VAPYQCVESEAIAPARPLHENRVALFHAHED
jgi:hypothetical protein